MYEGKGVLGIDSEDVFSVCLLFCHTFVFCGLVWPLSFGGNFLPSAFNRILSQILASL